MTLSVLNDQWTKGTYLIFRQGPDSASGTTHTWEVTATDNTRLGVIKWFPRWRKYSFFPEAQTVYEDVCLEDIMQFLREVNAKHRAKKKATRN